MGYIDRDLMFAKVREKAITKFDWSEQIDVDDFETIIKELPTVDVVEVPKWIDVKERLPKDNEKVLCLCQADIYEVLTWDNVQRHWVHDSNHIYFETFVRCWQALPEAPTKNDKE